MKIAKYIFLLLLLITATISVFVATKDGNYIVKKRQLIDVPREIVYNYVSDIKNWESINPWKEKSTKIKSLQKIDKQTIVQNIKINGIDTEMVLTFNDTLSKKTIITWTKKGKLSFKDKFLSIINRGTNNDFSEKFEDGLSSLNTILTTEINTFSLKINGFIERDTTYYIQQPISCKIEELPTKIKNILPKLEHVLTSTNTPKNGDALIIYHSNDSLNNKITFSIAIPVKHKIYTSIESDVITGQTNSFQAVKATLKGNYNHKKEAISKLNDFMIKNKLERSDRNKIFEIIPINSTTEKLASKWITEIYIPVRPKKVVIIPISVKKDSTNVIINHDIKNQKKL